MTTIASSRQAGAFEALDDLDPETLERAIGALVGSYQKTRSTLIAWFVVHYARALYRHPDYQGSDEDRCDWRRLAAHWQWLAQTPGRTAEVQG